MPIKAALFCFVNQFRPKNAAKNGFHSWNEIEVTGCAPHWANKCVRTYKFLPQNYNKKIKNNISGIKQHLLSQVIPNNISDLNTDINY